MNLNELAVIISEKEGLKKQINIAQIKEMLKITLRILKELSVEELAALFKKVK